MRGELKGVFILFKLTSLPTHQGVAGEETGGEGGGSSGGGCGGGMTLLTHTYTHTHNVYANHGEF